MFINHNVRFVFTHEEREAVDHKIEMVLEHLGKLSEFLEKSPQCRFLPVNLCPIEDCCLYHCIDCEIKAELFPVVRKCFEDCVRLTEHIQK